MRSTGLILITVAAVGFAVTDVDAHFILEAPAANLEQSPVDGDPQKDPPCGRPGIDTGAVTTFQAGTTITITLHETIHHPGHFRVALANTEGELPDAPDVTGTVGDECATTEIMDPPVFPVLADGLGVHIADDEDVTKSFDVTLPDMTCDNCVLQVMEYMSNHDAPCFYYHCANITIQEGPVMTTSATTTTGSGPGSGSGASGSGGAGSGGDDATSGGNPAFGEEDGGCSCTVVGARDNTSFAWLGLLGLGLASAYRRRMTAD